MAHVLGGKVEGSAAREYGSADVDVALAEGILSPFAQGERLSVWMSHGDRIAALPPGFRALASSAHTPFCVAGDHERRLYGVQFHPEVVHTPCGKDILGAFLFDIAHVTRSWTTASFTDSAIATVRARVGSSRAICGLSGGVDSSVAAMICERAIGERLTCIFVDNGLLRKNERETVVRTFHRLAPELRVVAVDASERFLSALAGITDPEQKRKTIGRVFIEVFEEEAKKVEDARFLVQGTLYPDVIESVSHKGPSAVIKSHHNVGGLPERMHLELVEPLRELFKDEVRAAGRELGMDAELVERQPFPGPGLAIRVLGEVTRERLATLRAADAIVTEEVRKAGLERVIWQSFCVLLPVRSVGVMGDFRSYEETCAIRAVTSVDGMTAEWAELPYALLRTLSSRIINEVPGINRVVYDVSSKPPATIEWE
jgi:GMP synthase (glutamine-hydrolysing)